jgi:hypothetical protein
MPVASTHSHDVRPAGETTSKRDGLRVFRKRERVRLPNIDIEAVSAHQSCNRLLSGTLGTSLAWNTHEILESRHDFWPQSTDRCTDRLLDIRRLPPRTFHNSDAGREVAPRSGNGVKDNWTSSRLMPSSAYVRHSS